MWIQIRLHGIEASPAFFSDVESGVCAALAHFAARVRSVRVQLADENGPRGGVDKRCRVAIALVRGGTIHVDERGSDARHTVSRALERGAGALARLVERRLDARRRGPGVTRRGPRT